MKILTDRKMLPSGGRCLSEIYLDEMYVQEENTDGMLLCYLLMNSEMLENAQLWIELKGELQWAGESYWYDRAILNRQYGKWQDFVATFKQRKVELWYIKCEYNTVPLTVNGTDCSPLISISYPVTAAPNLLSLCYAIETESYEYNSMPDSIRFYMERERSMPVKTAVNTWRKMQEEEDIFQEFSRCIQSGRFVPESEHPVSVEGYTAKHLMDATTLSAVGAYNYLISLRRNPQKALENLKKGLPRK